VRPARRLPELLQGFFHDWLVVQRNCSRHTVLAYRDARLQLLAFVAREKGRRVHDLDIGDVTHTEVLAFLGHLETERRLAIRTRNCRLAAVHSFFGYVADTEPTLVGQCAAVLRIPSKKTVHRTMEYLDVREVKAILEQQDRTTSVGQRDHTLLALLYNTGARISEVLLVRPSALQLASPAHVRLHGKGMKDRVCPLWLESVALIKALLKTRRPDDDDPLFLNRYGRPLHASGVRYKLKGYVKRAAAAVPTVATKRITPHSSATPRRST
jgi:integrase/recombinase XerC